MTQSYPPQKVEARSSFGSLFVAGLIVAAFLLIGLALSAVWYANTPTIYESSMTLLIESRSPKHDYICRHEQLIGEGNMVTRALIKHDLDKIPTLRDLPPNDQISYIQMNFNADRTDENGDVYRLRFQSHGRQGSSSGFGHARFNV